MLGNTFQNIHFNFFFLYSILCSVRYIPNPKITSRTFNLKSINNTIQGSTKDKFFHQPQKAKPTELTQNSKFKHSIFLTSGNA